GAKTLCWVPAFFSADAQKDLGLLVVLEHVLTGERFGQYAAQLSPQDRQAAKVSLESQRNQLRQRVLNHLDAAYGLDALAPGSLDTIHDLEPGEHYVSLLPGFEPRPPVAANLRQAMEGLLGQALAHEFPAAPDFEAEAKPLNLKKVHDVVEAAAAAPDCRVPVDKGLRSVVRAIVVPLRLGEMGLDATHFVLGQHWKSHFTRKAAEVGGEVTVKQLRKWIDSPKPMGLPKEAANLVILAFAAQTNRSFYQHGSPVEPTLQSLADNLELRQGVLPEEPVWNEAVRRAGELFGVAVSPLRSPANMAALVEKVKTKANEARKPCQNYGRRLRDGMTRLGLPADGGNRLKTVDTTVVLLEKVTASDGEAVVTAVATAPVATSETAMGGCIGKAAEFDGLLEGAAWDLVEVLTGLADGGNGEAQASLAELKSALTSDEHAVALGSALRSAQAVALRLVKKSVVITDARRVTPDVNVHGDSGKISGDTRRAVSRPETRNGVSLPEAQRLLAEIEASLQPRQSVRIDLSWTLEEDGTA
ncbi:MAG TPA: phage resistance protein, partial [Planctomycetaceae bacterium]